MHFSNLNSGSKTTWLDPRDFLNDKGSQVFDPTLILLVDYVDNTLLFLNAVCEYFFILNVFMNDLIDWFEIFTQEQAFLRVFTRALWNNTFYINMHLWKICLHWEVP